MEGSYFCVGSKLEDTPARHNCSGLDTIKDNLLSSTRLRSLFYLLFSFKISFSQVHVLSIVPLKFPEVKTNQPV